MKKLILAAVAVVFAIALAAPQANACPGHDKAKVVKKEKAEKQPTKVAKGEKKEADAPKN